MPQPHDAPNLLIQLLSDWAQASKRDAATLTALMEPHIGPARAQLVIETLHQLAATRADVEVQRAAGVEPARWVRRQLEGLRPGLTEELETTLLGEQPGDLIDATLSATLAPQQEHLDLLQTAVTHLGGLASTLFEEEPDTTLKAISALVSTAVIKTRQLTAPMEVMGVVAGVELGLRSVKTAYHLATGKLSLDQALEHLEHDAAAAVGTLAAHAVSFGAQASGAALGAALGQLIGSAPLGVLVGRQLGQLASGAIAPHVEAGVNQLTRTLLRSGVTLAKSAYESVRSFARGLLHA